MRKLLYFFIEVVILLITVSCNKVVENTNIPFAPVNFLIDTSISGVDNYLREDMLGNSRVYSLTSPAAMSAGYGSYGVSGVVVVRGIDNVLYAFDMCCPYEAKSAISLMSDGFFLQCPACGSQFSIGNGSGYVNKGPAKEPLKKYHVYRYAGEQYKIVN